MFVSKLHTTVITVWFVGLLLFLGVTVAMGAPLGRTLFLLGLGCLPPAIMVVIFRGAPARTISQVLYDEENASKEVANRLLQIEHARETDGTPS